jgi:uncharacterized protein YkwD
MTQSRANLFRVFAAAVLLPAAVYGQSAKRLETPPSASRAQDPTSSTLVCKQAAESILAKTNELRRKHQLNELKANKSLSKAALYFADYMAKHDEYSHTADGATPGQRAERYGYEYCILSENIASTYRTDAFQAKELAAHLVKGWENSPKHRENMLDPDVLEIGVAVAQSEKTKHVYAVQMFARPQSASINVTIANETNAALHYEIAGEPFTLPKGYIQSHGFCRPTNRRSKEVVPTAPRVRPQRRPDCSFFQAIFHAVLWTDCRLVLLCTVRPGQTS